MIKWTQLCVWLCTLVAASAGAVFTPDAPQINAKGYVVMDYHSGQVIASQNPDTPLAPASLTKLMTAYVVGQEINSGRLNWDDKATISRNAWSVNFPESSKMFIKPGDEISIRNLMLGVIVQSGNDASVALAEHVAGSESAFVSLMNGWTQTLGMENTQFINAHGLDGDNIQTTPKDMANLMRAIIKDVPEVYKLYQEKKFTWNDIEQYNRNKLLWDRSLNVDGGKTGYTENAGYSLVSSATEGRMRLISVVMGTPNQQARTSASRNILGYGFRFFDTVQVAKKDEVIMQSRVWKGAEENVPVTVTETVYLTFPRAMKDSLKQEVVVESQLQAPIAAGDSLGQVIWSLNGEQVFTAPAVSQVGVDQGSFASRVMDTFQLWLRALVSGIKAFWEGE
ncbi:D-alanyl-D-alanine carboxypeptidase family protein [Vibrio coralliilyticus]|uniref:D-alanyl-D-alanine carboxypeptidase family protein n=1 Tax=Vibrio coralliilyticus TaxID=190893 RepID=UPI00155F93BB|nr:D-alanyl-D-alanine carboxypeptidase family protein [Vibrio coralliilyticus]NRF16855.1 D-alanyl-D-alanine carboxypeptidase [Vibrio coralliilyticus]